MAGFLAFLTPIRDLFFKEKNPERAFREIQPHLKARLSPEEKRAVYELTGLMLRDMRQYAEAVKCYLAINDSYQAGYCEMLQGNLAAVRSHWGKTAQLRQNHWCVTLFGMISRQLMSYPTTFQIRNYLESDITSLIRAGQFEYLENLLVYCDFLVQINPETHKFAGRSLLHSGWLDRAGPFLLKGQKALPNDPEIYFHLGQYSTQRGLNEDARIMLHQCLLISPTYNPAKELLARLSENTD